MLALRRCNARASSLARLYSDQKSLHNQPIIDFLTKCTHTISFAILPRSLLSNPGQQQEESRPDVNSFKITAYKHAIRSVSQVQQPILLGNDISKVCNPTTQHPSPERLFYQLPGIGSSIMTKINEFLYASETLENRRQSPSNSFLIPPHANPKIHSCNKNCKTLEPCGCCKIYQA